MRSWAHDPELMYRRRWITLVVICMSLMVIGLDNTILNVALPTLGRQLARHHELAAVDRRHLHPCVRRPAADRGLPR